MRTLIMYMAIYSYGYIAAHSNTEQCYDTIVLLACYACVTPGHHLAGNSNLINICTVSIQFYCLVFCY